MDESFSPRRFNFIWISPTPDGSIKPLTLHRYLLQSHTHFKVPPVLNSFLFKPQKKASVTTTAFSSGCWPLTPGQIIQSQGERKMYSNIIWIPGRMERCLSLSSACVLNASTQPHVNSTVVIPTCCVERQSLPSWTALLKVILPVWHTNPLSHAHITLTSFQL